MIVRMHKRQMKPITQPVHHVTGGAVTGSPQQQTAFPAPAAASPALSDRYPHRQTEVAPPKGARMGRSVGSGLNNLAAKLAKLDLKDSAPSGSAVRF